MKQVSRPNDPDEHEITRRALDLIHQQRTMTLATAHNNTAWAAPVYYVFHNSGFYFFSKPQSQHIRQASKNDTVSAAIHADAGTWQEIQGIQMAGNIRRVRPGSNNISTVNEYLRKYPFTKDFFERGQPLDLVGILERFKVKFYKFEPDIVFYLDNRVRFGFKAEVNIR